MRPINYKEIKAIKLKVASLLTSAILLSLIIAGSLAASKPALPTNKKQLSEKDISISNELLQADILLHSKLQNIMKLDAQRNTLKADDLQIPNLQSRINLEEIAFNELLDSIVYSKKNSGKEKADKFKKLTDQFRQTFAIRFSNTRQVTSSPTPAQDSSKTTDDNLLEKLTAQQKTIAQLRAQLKQSAGGVNNNPSSLRLKKLEEEVEFLGWALRSQVKTLDNYKAANKQLKEQLAGLKKK